MNIATSIICAAVLVVAGLLAQRALSQATTTAPTIAYVVASCGTHPTIPASTGWSYSAGNWAPLTMSTGGALCVNQ